MDCRVPDSDDEGHVSYHTNRHNANAENQHLEKIYSDDEGDAWEIAANYHNHVQATPHTQAPVSRPQKMFSFGRKPTLTGVAKASRQQQFGRKLVSSAVVARQQSKEEEENELGGIDWSLGGSVVKSSQQSVSVAAPLVAARPAFVGRAPPPALKPLPQPSKRAPAAVVSAPNTEDKDTINKPRTDSAPRNVEQTDRSTATAPPTSTRPSSQYAPPPSSTTAPAAASNFGNKMATHINDDGMNVVYSKRKRSGDDATAGPASKTRATVNSGWGNNFVRIDMKKGRGSTKFRSSRHTNNSRRRPGRGRWKTQRLRQVGDGAEFMEGWENGSKSSCFKCGGKGHWAKDCQASKEVDSVGDSGEEDLSDNDGIAAAKTSLPPLPKLPQDGESLPPLPLPAAAAIELEVDIEALCEEETLEKHVKDIFGYSAFRGLQLTTIRKILRGESCLSIMPTGMGKSLCYQLPALLLPGLTLVVSPLIALMHDQCRAAPSQLNPAVLWSGQTPIQAREVLRDVENGTIRLLFISPERLGNPYLLAALRPRMPLTAVVIDEAHCVAEWGHSFRPSYFRLGEILQRDISTRSVLALTATATKATEAAVCGVLRIPQSQVLRDSAIRQNLRLHVVHSQGTPCSRAGTSGGGSWHQVLSLFKGGPLADSRSSIVYCAWKSDADSLAAALVGAGVNAKAYHAGRSYQDRSNIEAAFASGRLRVVVATVAFGMGIDIASVDAVVHATMPRSLEEYVQQIGRAGRDGSEGRCFAYLSEQDFISLRSLAYSGVVTKESVKMVLSRVFPVEEEEEAEDEKLGKNSDDDDDNDEEEEEDWPSSDDDDVDPTKPKFRGSIPKKARKVAETPLEKRRFGVLNSRKLATESDMQEESIEAILGYLEADEQPYLRVLPKVANTAKISFYAAPAEQMAQEYSIVSSVLSICSKPRNGLYSVNTAKLAEAVQKPPGAVLQDLQTLAQQKLIGFEFSKETGPGFEILRHSDSLDDLTDSIHARLSTMLRCQVARLDTVYRSLSNAMSQPAQSLQESSLRDALEEYFARQEAAGLALTGGIVDPCAALDLEGLPLRHAPESMLQAAKAALRRNKEQGGPPMSPMYLARVLHGMGSAAMPRDVWCKRMGAFWGNMKNVDFTAVINISTLACKSFLD